MEWADEVHIFFFLKGGLPRDLYQSYIQFYCRNSVLFKLLQFNIVKGGNKISHWNRPNKQQKYRNRCHRTDNIYNWYHRPPERPEIVPMLIVVSCGYGMADALDPLTCIQGSMPKLKCVGANSGSGMLLSVGAASRSPFLLLPLLTLNLLFL
jgi:hypothetical protein